MIKDIFISEIIHYLKISIVNLDIQRFYNISHNFNNRNFQKNQ